MTNELEILVEHRPGEQIKASELEPGKQYKEVYVDNESDHICKSNFLVLAVRNTNGTKQATIAEIINFEEFVRDINFADLGLVLGKDNIGSAETYLVPADSTLSEPGETLPGYGKYSLAARFEKTKESLKPQSI